MNKTTIPANGMQISHDTVFAPGVYYLPDGIQIAASGVHLDGNGALLIGSQQKGRGVSIKNLTGIAIKNLRLAEYEWGIYAQACKKLDIRGCQVRSSAEIAPGTIFLDVWRDADQAYGAGILLREVTNSTIRDCDLQHQMNGLVMYGCRQLQVINNLANYCSGWGFLLYDTSDCLCEANWADFCCRYQPRAGGQGHMGADAAGFLIIYRSCRNIFRRNMARMSGDGFFLAGLDPKNTPVGCDDNLFEENDGSFSPNIAFEATFSRGNIYRRNRADRCNYGFWMGFSRQSILESNQITGNRQAGIATENGFGFQVRDNIFRDNGHGILLWSKRLPKVEMVLPENNTSYNWQILNNEFTNNGKAIRIAADQDHGIRALSPGGEWGLPALKPYNHIIEKNRFEGNVRTIDVSGAQQPSTQDNTFKNNLDQTENFTYS